MPNTAQPWCNVTDADGLEDWQIYRCGYIKLNSSALTFPFVTISRVQQEKASNVKNLNIVKPLGSDLSRNKDTIFLDVYLPVKPQLHVLWISFTRVALIC